MGTRRCPDTKEGIVNEIIYSSTSGSPATLVSIDRIPASADAEATATQFTSLMRAEVPIVAIAVWHTVLIALMPAAFHHAFDFMSPTSHNIN